MLLARNDRHQSGNQRVDQNNGGNMWTRGNDVRHTTYVSRNNLKKLSRHNIEAILEQKQFIAIMTQKSDRETTNKSNQHQRKKESTMPSQLIDGQKVTHNVDKPSDLSDRMKQFQLAAKREKEERAKKSFFTSIKKNKKSGTLLLKVITIAHQIDC